MKSQLAAIQTEGEGLVIGDPAEHAAPATATGTAFGHQRGDAETGTLRTSAAVSGADLLLHVLRKSDSRRWLCADVLLRPSFLQHLEREKWRADRSKAPLSIVVCECSATGDEALRNHDLAKALVGAKRQTDVVGQLGDGLFAVLLPDTNASGAQIFTEKIKKRVAPDLEVPTLTRTYPDEMFESLLAGTDIPLDAFPFMEQRRPTHEGGLLAKRCVDVVGALALLVLFTPIMLVTAAAIALTSHGSVIFRQTRLGQGGVPFVFYKFRSMRSDVDDRIHRQYIERLIDGELDDINQGDSQRPLYKIKMDPRVTRIGRFLRKTSIDELPQLFNVLKGEMSLVGPRPPIAYEVRRYQPWHLRRILGIKPGITGLWQVAGRSRTSFDEMVRLDLRYIRERSLALDICILIRTVYVVLKCDGAN
jgi:lipopolysaccharide/colanic/teichoic acid biosynthesis glycosyltransferase